MVRIEGLPHSADVAQMKTSSYDIELPPYDILVVRLYVKRGSVTKEHLDALTGKDKPKEYRTIVVGAVDRAQTRTSLGSKVMGLFFEEDEADDVAETQPKQG